MHAFDTSEILFIYNTALRTAVLDHLNLLLLSLQSVFPKTTHTVLHLLKEFSVFGNERHKVTVDQEIFF